MSRCATGSDEVATRGGVHASAGQPDAATDPGAAAGTCPEKGAQLGPQLLSPHDLLVLL